MHTIAEAAAKAAVEETLLSIGINVKDPIQAQKDFMVLREVGKLVMDSEFRKDMEHLRSWRLSIKEAKAKGVLAIIGIVITGSIGLLVAGFEGWVRTR